MMCAAKILFVLAGLLFSVFYGWKAVDIFVDTETAFIKQKQPLWAWCFHQRWLNFVGSFVGWAAAYYYIFFRVLPLHAFAFKAEDTLIILIAVLGIVGFLPYTLSKVTGLKG